MASLSFERSGISGRSASLEVESGGRESSFFAEESGALLAVSLGTTEI